MSDYPEHDKQRDAIAPEPVNDTLTRFWDWMQREGLVIAKWSDQHEKYVPCTVCTVDGVLHPTGKDTSKLRTREVQAIKEWPRRDGAGGNPVVPIHLRDDYDVYLKKVLDPLPDCPTCRGMEEVTTMVTGLERLVELGLPPTRLFAWFLDLDLDKLEAEKRQMLEALHAA